MPSRPPRPSPGLLLAGIPFRALVLASLWTLAAAGPAPPVAAAQALPADPAADLAARIQAFIQAPRFQASVWGIQVVSLDTGRVLFQHDAGKYFLPASNAKLFTAAMALQELGPELRIRTSLYAAAPPGADGTLAGDLVLYGRGDPTLQRPWDGGPAQADPFEALALQLQARGVRRIQGDLVGDDSYFDAPPYGSGWEVEDLSFAYGAEPTALAVHGNVVDLWVYPGLEPGRPCFLFAQPGHGLFAFQNQTRTAPTGMGTRVRADRAPGEQAIRVTGTLAAGSAPVRLTVTVRDSALLAARLLERALARQGIQVRGQARAVHAQDRAVPLDPAGLAELGHLDSPPLEEIVRLMLKRSDNLYAQLVLLHAGARSAAPGAGDTARRALAVLDGWMARAGLAPGDAVLEDGAGLSRRNLVKPAAIVKLLAYMDRQPEAGPFRAALSLAGVDGTLRARMDGTPAQGSLGAKTGTLRHTFNLSGYVTAAGGERLAFSLMLNNYLPAPRTVPRAELDALGAILAAYPGREPGRNPGGFQGD